MITYNNNQAHENWSRTNFPSGLYMKYTSDNGKSPNNKHINNSQLLSRRCCGTGREITMRWTVEMGRVSMILIPDFIKIGSDTKKLIGAD
jgi:hypothetical protein